MTNAQTEARAIAQDIVDAFHPMDDVSVHMIADVAERIIATALAAKDAELAEMRCELEEMSKCVEYAENDLARIAAERDAVIKALEPFAKAVKPCPECISGWKFGIHPSSADFRAAHLAFESLGGKHG